MKIFGKILLAFIFVMSLNATSYAHSGRTDANGGHNCSLKSQQKGLCSGYHYHNKNYNFNKKN